MPPIDARLRGQRHEIDHALLGRDARDSLGHADAEIDDGVRLELERRASGDDLALGELHRFEPRCIGTRISPANAGLYGSTNVCMWYSGFSATTTQSTRMPGILTCRGLSVPRSAMTLDLHDHDAAGVAHRHRDRERLERERLALHRHVAVRVGGRAADDADVDRKGPVEQVLLAVDFDQRHQILGRALVDLAAAEARIDERAEADARELARLAGGDVAEQVRDHALRQVVGLDLVRDRERLQLRHESPVAADDALEAAPRSRGGSSPRSLPSPWPAA